MARDAYIEHGIEKAADIAELAAQLVDHDTAIPALFIREGVDKWRYKPGDKITYRVPGRLPYRKQAFRHDRTRPRIFDVYKESKVDVTWGDIIYSGAELTDEQQDFDLVSTWEPIVSEQAKAVAQGVNDEGRECMESAPFAVTIGGTEADLWGAIVEARRVLNAFRAPGKRLLIVGSDFEGAMLLDKRLTYSGIAGDAYANSILSTAVLGQLGGFTVVLDNTIDPGSAYAAVDTAFVQYSGAPVVPRSVYAGATVSLPSGTQARWVMDYDMLNTVDRSAIDTYVGSAPITDIFLPKSVLETGLAPKTLDPSSLKPHFVRAIKLTLDGASAYPAPTGPTKDLVDETGISSAKAWKPRVSTPPVGATP